MSRSFLRVVVVAVVAFSLTLSLGTVAQARPHDPAGPAPVAAAHSGWLESVLAWLTRLATGEKPAPIVTGTDANRPSGSCIDPLGGRCL